MDDRAPAVLARCEEVLRQGWLEGERGLLEQLLDGARHDLLRHECLLEGGTFIVHDTGRVQEGFADLVLAELLADNLQGNYVFINAARAVKVPFDKGYYAEFKVKDFSEFWLNNGGLDNNTPLPVELISFTASKAGTDVLLRWTTASEQDVDHFEIEVARGNQNYILGQFIKLGDQPSGGNSVTEQHYSFTDHEANKSGNRYYRLRVVDLDGSVKYSPVRIVSFNTEFTWQIYPNPSDGRFTLSSQAEPGDLIRLRVINTEGKKLQEFEVRGTGFAQLIPIDLSKASFTPGIYLLEVSSGAGKQVFRLVKQ